MVSAVTRSARLGGWGRLNTWYRVRSLQPPFRASHDRAYVVHCASNTNPRRPFPGTN